MKIIDFKTRETLDNSSFVIIKKIYVETKDKESIQKILLTLSLISNKIKINYKSYSNKITEVHICLEQLKRKKMKEALYFIRQIYH